MMAVSALAFHRPAVSSSRSVAFQPSIAAIVPPVAGGRRVDRIRRSRDAAGSSLGGHGGRVSQVEVDLMDASSAVLPDGPPVSFKATGSNAARAASSSIEHKTR